MAGFTDTLENALLDHVFNGASYSTPTKWIGLFTVAPTDASSGTEVTSTGGYTRIAAATWTTASSGYTYNSTAIAFPTATGDWGTIDYFAVCTSSAGGAMIAYSSLAVSKTIATGDSVTFSTGSLVVTLD
ncbi:MAG TPA: hypothetical protein VLH56_02300 [Dissulfurispiraceae bacterium]|nr:hypothetical protein [Dissulfurispiraceae bacterium]